MKFNFDVIVVGAGHAGCEAARAAARLGSEVLLITMDLEKIAQMSCNPAVGGIAKGQLVREIDALGGFMAKATDRSTIQFRMLNRSKGPAMWSPRAQCDRMQFSHVWRRELEATPNLSLVQGMVTELLFKDNMIAGVKTTLGVSYYAKSVVLTNGTFLNGLLHVGKVQVEGGRTPERASFGITEQLTSLGFRADRMKTGTPPRIDGRTIDFSHCQVQEGEEGWHQFSFTDLGDNKRLKQRPCYISYTNEEAHRVLADRLDDSPLYNGQIVSIGPRYCPSIETKITTFPDKDKHQLFLEPEGQDTYEYYVNGFSSSMPVEVQLEAMRKIPALAHAHVIRPGYAVEYDFFDPTQLYHTLETKLIPNLFFAGQINGTTGYEEAAGQGLVAGVNAHRKAVGDDKPFTLSRDQAYIGVLIDDLVTKGVDEPYRMFTSRAEYRILLRQDNSDARLTPLGIAIGLVGSEQKEFFSKKMQAKEDLRHLLASLKATPNSEIDRFVVSTGDPALSFSIPLADLLRRPRISISDLVQCYPQLTVYTDEVLEAVEVEIKYQGYIDRERALADKAKRLEDIVIRGHFNYAEIASLSTEARMKLMSVDPETIGQASRIPGVSPSDINVLLVLMGR